MSKLVEVKCPAKISLFLNALGFDEKQDLINFKMLNQTVDLYDIITLKEESNLSGTIVNMNEKILSKDNIYEIACNLFFEYTNIKPKGLYIDIKKNIFDNLGLGGQASDIAGILLGLDRYYRTELPKKKLAALGYQLDIEVPYFIKGGYCNVKNYGLDVETNANKNIFKNYLLIQPNIEYDLEKMYNNIKKGPYIQTWNTDCELYNVFNKFMPQELRELREFLNGYSKNHSLAGNGISYFVAYPGLFSSGISLRLKKEFPNYKLETVSNVNGHVILTKY